MILEDVAICNCIPQFSARNCHFDSLSNGPCKNQLSLFLDLQALTNFTKLWHESCISINRRLKEKVNNKHYLKGGVIYDTRTISEKTKK